MVRLRGVTITLIAAFLIATPTVAAASPVGTSPSSLVVRVLDSSGKAISNSRVHVAVMWPTEALWQKHGRSSDVEATTNGSGLANFALGTSAPHRKQVVVDHALAHVDDFFLAPAPGS